MPLVIGGIYSATVSTCVAPGASSGRTALRRAPPRRGRRRRQAPRRASRARAPLPLLPSLPPPNGLWPRRAAGPNCRRSPRGTRNDTTLRESDCLASDLGVRGGAGFSAPRAPRVVFHPSSYNGAAYLFTTPIAVSAFAVLFWVDEERLPIADEEQSDCLFEGDGDAAVVAAPEQPHNVQHTGP